MEYLPEPSLLTEFQNDLKFETRVIKEFITTSSHLLSNGINSYSVGQHNDPQ